MTMPIIMIVSAFAGLVSSGGAPLASISMGKGDMDSAEQTLGGCFFLVIVSIVLTVVLLLFGENLLLAFGASENTIEYAVSYLNIYAFGTLFVPKWVAMVSGMRFQSRSPITIGKREMSVVRISVVLYFFHIRSASFEL